MIIAVEKQGELHLKAFLVPQDVESSEPLEAYLTSVRRIEQKTGLNFHPLLERALADSLENMVLEYLW